MSYLGTPRIVFAGTFTADPPTVNNDPYHWDDNRFTARYQQLATPPQLGGWNPRGTGNFGLSHCRVTGAFSESCSDFHQDGAVGGLVVQPHERVSAKIVDLDPEQKMVSEIWGLKLQVLTANGKQAFVGSFRPAPIADLWQRWPGGIGLAAGGAAYQSVLKVDWSDDPDSDVLRQLKATSECGFLSIKFNLDGCDVSVNSPTFGTGRIVGVIGPYCKNEPAHFVAGRLLQPPSTSTLNFAPCRLDAWTKTLFLDLGNSLPSIARAGSLQDIGVIQIVAQPPNGRSQALTSVYSVTGDFYNVGGGIVQSVLGDDQFEAASSTPLAVIDTKGAILLTERGDGKYVRADASVFRIYPENPNNSVSTTLYATQFGQPLRNSSIDVWLDSSVMQQQQDYGPFPGPPAGIPERVMHLPQNITTDDNGCAKLTVSATPPGNPRGYIDGQVYGIAYGPDRDGTVAQNVLSVLVWDLYPVPKCPTWVGHVQPILQKYANLYPIMRDVVDLTDYNSVSSRRTVLHQVLSLPPEDPNAMPVTRDLSPGKRCTLLTWLKESPPRIFEIVDVPSLRQLLQLAIELEHSTIPPYLCAYMSIKPGRNLQVAEIIRSVVLQEMLHLTLAANILNAVGGEPVINKARFIPRYPSHLPGGVRPDLVVRLRKASIEHIRDEFMAIEEPSQLINAQASDVDPGLKIATAELNAKGRLVGVRADELREVLRTRFSRSEHPRLTIGWFYTEIARGITNLGDAIFVGDKSRQITPMDWPEAPGRLYSVEDEATALLAIHEIIREGEGTSCGDPLDGRELAHYYKFKEIVEGRKLIPIPNVGWKFEGERIPFDAHGVWPMIDDPDASSLPLNSKVRAQSIEFDRTYSALLDVLQRVFSGRKDLLGDAVGLMFSLTIQGQELVRQPIGDGSGLTAGPSFQVGSVRDQPTAGPSGDPSIQARTSGPPAH